MKRHRSLVPLSHDHHLALVEARRLRRAAGGPESSAAVAHFLRFFAAETARHFRKEEEVLFPAAVGFDEAQEPLLQALLEHQRVRALAEELRAGDSRPDTMRELGELLHDHVRHEERVLFPLVERLLGDSGLATLDFDNGGLGAAATRSSGGGPAWGTESEDLNATLLEWSAGSGPPEHVNEERDVLVTVLDGSAALALGGEERLLERSETVVIAKGSMRRITAGPDGVRYLSVHLRRPPLQIASRPPSPLGVDESRGDA